MNVIADTGFLVALLEVHDHHHGWAKAVAQEIHWPLLTCESVLSETAFHVRASSFVLDMVQSESIQVAFSISEHLDHLRELALRYADRRPDLADLCIIRMSEMYPRHVVLTIDEEDFRVYRRNKREAIPILCPPGK